MNGLTIVFVKGGLPAAGRLISRKCHKVRGVYFGIMNAGERKAAFDAIADKREITMVWQEQGGLKQLSNEETCSFIPHKM